MTPKQIAIVGFDDIASLDLTGPLEAFSAAVLPDAKGKLQPCYAVSIATLDAQGFCSESGLRMTGSGLLSSLRNVDTLVVPGGSGLRLSTDDRLANWIHSRASSIRRIATVCTGIYGVAPTGLLNGRRVTTHWRHAADLAARFQALKVDADALYIRDGKFYTSAGVTAGIDLSLALIEEDFGPQVALAVARELVVYMRRPGGQNQFSEPLRFQLASSGRLADLAAWIVTHLEQNLSIETLAAHVHLSPRQLARRFKAEFKDSPAAFVQRLRLDEARRRLSDGEGSIESIANAVGFSDADGFRRAFVQRYGVAPLQYRITFPGRSDWKNA
jgi:transcriptional regulator GlxA family with amidase domain